MADIILDPGQTLEAQAQAILAAAGPDRAHLVEWRPRPDVPLGGVYYAPDDVAADYTASQQATTTKGKRGSTKLASAAQTQEAANANAGVPTGNGDPNNPAQGGGGSAVPASDPTAQQ